MGRLRLPVWALVLATAAPGLAAHADPPPPSFRWQTVVNDGDLIPGTSKPFNSYNPPSVNEDARVVFRARGKGPGEPPHGVFTRQMSGSPGPLVTLADRSTEVPPPNNQGSTFNEFPSFPRIDRTSDLIAFRGNFPPAYRPSPETEPEGTTGVFATPDDTLLTAAMNLGDLPELSFFAVPGSEPPLAFDVFPGAPSATDGSTVVFKGNYTEDGVSKTGVYFRELEPAPEGGSAPIERIADNTVTRIPGSRPSAVFGSVAPPSADGRTAVFAGFDNEDAPTQGGLYRAPLAPDPDLETLVRIGQRVPDRNGRPTGDRFNRLGEALSYDGRLLGFWGAWGSATRSVTVHCPTEGNAARRAYCLAECPEPSGCTFAVPLHQGIFAQDTVSGDTWRVAQTGDRFLDFLFWSFSGKVPGVEGGEDEGEPARWRASPFLAIEEGEGRTFQEAFEGQTPGGAVAIALGVGPSRFEPVTLVDTTEDGSLLDPSAAGLPITELALERDGFRGGHLAIAARMGTEESGWAGIYLGHASPPAERDGSGDALAPEGTAR